MRNRLARLPTWAKILAPALFAALVIPAYNGIVGNRADAVFMWSLTLFGDWQTLVVVTALLVAMSIGVVLGWAWNRPEDPSLDTAIGLLDFDDSMFRLLPSLVSSDTTQAKLRKFLEEVLKDCTRAFGDDVHRAMILHPRRQGKWLEPLAHRKIPDETRRCSRYYVGNDGKYPGKVGFAGSVYLSREQRVVHFDKHDGRWQPDDESYIKLPSTGSTPSYRAVAAVPILWGDERLGVLCLDSMNKDIFDGEATRELLATLGTRIAASIVL